MKSTQDVHRSVVDNMKKERKTLKQEIVDKLKKRNEVHATFRKANNKWYDYHRAVKAQRKMKYDEEKKQRKTKKNKADSSNN